MIARISVDFPLPNTPCTRRMDGLWSVEEFEKY